MYPVGRDYFSTKMSKKYNAVFRSVYKEEFPCLSESRKGQTYAFCNICRCDFSVSHGGKSDILKHVQTKKHKESLQCVESNQKLSYLCKSQSVDAVTNAEALFTSFIVEHNLPTNCADHAGPLFRKMFPDSEIAKRYGCARTKTTAIITEMCMEERTKVITYIQENPFSIATDGSNKTDFKLYPIVVTFFSPELREIQNCLLSVPNLEGDATGVNIADLLLSTLREFHIPLKYCLAFGADNAPVMVGQKKGVAACLKQEIGNLIIVGCPCHLINLAAEKGAACLPLNVDENIIDIFYYLERSAKRKEKFRKFQTLHDTEVRKILKHVPTRWLSLKRCLDRILDQWNPLLSLFKDEIVSNDSGEGTLKNYKIPKHIQSADVSNSEPKSKHYDTSSAHSSLKRKTPSASALRKTIEATGDSTSHVLSREERLFMFLSSDLYKSFCLFLSSFMPVFEGPNVVLQSGVPHIHLLRTILEKLLKNVMARFVKPVAINTSSSLTGVDYHTLANQKDDCDLLIGNATFALVTTLKPEEKSVFFKSVRKCFSSSCDYMIHKFPFKDEVLIHAEVADISNIGKASFSSLRFFINRFPDILTREMEQLDAEVDILHSQFCNFQLQETNITAERIDVQWALIGQMKSADGVLKYDRLAKVMLAILSIPHSNAECERIFSTVTKTKTQFRSMLSETSLEKFLILKSVQKGKCFEQKFSPEFLKKAKSATTSVLNN